MGVYWIGDYTDEFEYTQFDRFKNFVQFVLPTVQQRCFGNFFTNASRYFGFVTFESAEDAHDAVSQGLRGYHFKLFPGVKERQELEEEKKKKRGTAARSRNAALQKKP